MQAKTSQIQIDKKFGVYLAPKKKKLKSAIQRHAKKKKLSRSAAVVDLLEIATGTKEAA